MAAYRYTDLFSDAVSGFDPSPQSATITKTECFILNGSIYRESRVRSGPNFDSVTFVGEFPFRCHHCFGGFSRVTKAPLVKQVLTMHSFSVFAFVRVKTLAAHPHLV